MEKTMRSQCGLTERLSPLKVRCANVKGGIKAVARLMGRAENTLHNWFRGDTTPRVEDIELLKKKLTECEAADALARKEREKKLNSLL